MPRMFRAGGIKADFKSIEEGKKQGFYPTFNEMAIAWKAQNAPEKTQDEVVEESLSETFRLDDEPVADEPVEPLEDDTQEDLLGQEEESLDVESGADQTGVFTTQD